MNNYYDLTTAELVRLDEATGYEWEWWHTGGGCSAYVLEVHDEADSYWLITCDATAPINADEWNEVTLGFYSDTNGHEGDIVEGVTNFAEVVAYFRTIHDLEVAPSESCDECGATMVWDDRNEWSHEATPTAHECHTARRWGLIGANNFQVVEFGVGVYRTSNTIGEFRTFAEAQAVAHEYEAKYRPVNSDYRTEIFTYEGGH